MKKARRFNAPRLFIFIRRLQYQNHRMSEKADEKYQNEEIPMEWLIEESCYHKRQNRTYYNPNPYP